MIRIKYFKKSNNGICGSDFHNIQECVDINSNYILSISDLKEFSLPLSKEYVSKYSILIMSNNDKYFIKEESYNNLINDLGKYTTGIENIKKIINIAESAIECCEQDLNQDWEEEKEFIQKIKGIL